MSMIHHSAYLLKGTRSAHPASAAVTLVQLVFDDKDTKPTELREALKKISLAPLVDAAGV